ADRYQIVDIAGRGGLGTVYRATDELLARTVAVKVLHPRFSNSDEFRAMLVGEAQIHAGLEHPNIVRVYDRGETAGLVFMVTEYVAGRTLKQILSIKRPLSIEYSVRIIRRSPKRCSLRTPGPSSTLT